MKIKDKRAALRSQQLIPVQRFISVALQSVCHHWSLLHVIYNNAERPLHSNTRPPHYLRYLWEYNISFTRRAALDAVTVSRVLLSRCVLGNKFPILKDKCAETSGRTSVFVCFLEQRSSTCDSAAVEELQTEAWRRREPFGSEQRGPRRHVQGGHAGSGSNSHPGTSVQQLSQHEHEHELPNPNQPAAWS